MTYRSSYELELEYGFALLEQLEGPEGAYTYRPTGGDDSLDDVYLEGVFGGHLGSGNERDFLVYSLEWPEDMEEFDEEVIDRVRQELDGLFTGWVLDEKRRRVYIPLQ
jgi:hypothetical protein